jgi:hypothetical protein
MSETNAEGETVEDRQDWKDGALDGEPSVVLGNCTLNDPDGAGTKF